MDTDRMMSRMGFAPQDSGPYVTLLRERVARQISEGVVNRSAGSWAEECYERDENGFITGYTISAEERARAMLEMEWAMERGHSYETKVMDDLPINWQFDTNSMRWRPRFKPSRLMPWLGDRSRELGMKYRVWRDRILGVRNPYARS